MTEMVTTCYLQPGYDFADGFEFGLELLLHALARMLTSEEIGRA